MTAPTERLYLEDSYLREFEAEVVAFEDGRVAFDRTAFYPTGGGQPYDTGHIMCQGRPLEVVEVHSEDDVVWHVLVAGQLPCPVGSPVTGHLDWERRHALMRTHTSLHILTGVISQQWDVPVTGGNMTPLEGRLDFEFGPFPENFQGHLTDLLNAEVTADRPIRASFLDRDNAQSDPTLLRTKEYRVPDEVQRVRVVEIVGLDKQLDGGTHVASTAEVGPITVTKLESKGKANKRIRLRLTDQSVSATFSG
jgi:misacylated tRNA(Ala) deacylase